MSSEPSAAANSATDTSQPLKVGANVGNVPWEFEGKSGKLVGFEIDLINEIAKRLGRQVEFVNTPFTGLFPAVLSNRIDAAVSSITITPKRMETLDFAQPYYDSDQLLTVKANSGITSVKDLKGKVVAVDTGSTGDIWVKDHLQEYSFKEVRRFEGLNPAMLDLTAGRFDGYISDIPATLYYTKDKPELKVVERIKAGEQYSVMFAKGNPLRDEFNTQIEALKKDGTLAKLYEKWFGSAPEAGTSTVEVVPLPSPSP
ncbi:basic amino acid ABC transporter substrate-binding protein [Leptolyngbya sp. FACHB-261]|nr:basic amino acid ABC transporter substrate-binding protein [Leptolyngbya sp. FACHB-261]